MSIGVRANALPMGCRCMAKMGVSNMGSGGSLLRAEVLTGKRDPGLERSRLKFLDQLVRRGVSAATINAISMVPREWFVTEALAPDAYEDVALPTTHGQTISQPSLVATMIDLLELDPSYRVLEVGAGSGYQAAVLSLLAAHVVSVERVPELTETAKTRLHRFGYSNCRIEQANDEIGWPAGAPYDRIIVAAAAPKVPAALSSQLGPGGKMVIPVGRRSGQDLLVVTRESDGLTVKKAGKCMFVPLIGRDAWADT